MKNQKHAPKILDVLTSFFPLVLSLVAASSFFILPTLHAFLLSTLMIYLIPPMAFQIVNQIWPLTTGVTYLGKKAEHGNIWYASHQFQWLFNSFPYFERVLMMVPGLYSVWLRLWGAKIGKKVNWTPESKIVDRPMIEIGDRALIGNRSYISSHAIKKKEGRYLLWIAPVKIGSDTVLAYACQLAPGVEVGNNCFVEAMAALYPKEKVLDGESYVRKQI